MPLLQIRDVPDAVRRTLKARAAAEGSSLNSYLLRVLSREAGQPTVAEVMDRATRRAERSPFSVVEMLEAARSERDEEIARRVGL